MSKETAPSEKTKKDELKPQDEIQANVRDQGKVSDDENQMPNEEVQDAASDEDPEALVAKEEKAEANDEETDKSSDDISHGPQAESTEEKAGEESSSSDEPEKVAEKVLEEVAEDIEQPQPAVEGKEETTAGDAVEENGEIKESGEIEESDVADENIVSQEEIPEQTDADPGVEKTGESISGTAGESSEPEQVIKPETEEPADDIDEVHEGLEETQPAPEGESIEQQPTIVESAEPSTPEPAESAEDAEEAKEAKVESVSDNETDPTAESEEEGSDQKQTPEETAETGVSAIHEETEHADNEDDIHDDGDELVHADYSQYSKEELVNTIKKLTKIDDFKKLDLVLNIVDPLFQKIKSEDRKAALEKYIAEGGSEEDFAYKNELDQKYDAYYKLIKERKHKYYGDLGRQKLENYQKASELLEKLRHLVDGEESTTSINAIKQIQEEWKSIGQVPPQHVRNLWASYNALMDRFYDNRSIYFELKELDRRKNLAAKEELCVRAEKLEEVANLKDAIKELNELHNEYKHIGPVPKSNQEALWQRFKAASDKVYARRKTYYEDLKKDLEVNLEAKAKLRDEVQPFAEFDSDRIVEWNKKTQEILDIQKRWEAIGGLPRDRAHEVNKPFWSAFKRFFNNKNAFFKKLEGQREDNLKLKEELVAKANELKDSTDWNQTANELKKLQNDWRNIGPVPEKYRNDVYQRFKQACDFFFENRRNRFKEVEKEYEKNLKLKEDVCHRILKLAEEGAGDIGQLEALQEEWNNIGFVPKNAIRSSQEMFAKAVDKFIASSSLDDEEKNKLKITTRLTSLKGTPNANRKLNKKEFTLRRQITNLENDITLWKNNLEFFANSKNADQVREEFEGKIENAKKQLEELKAQLKIIRDI